MVNSEWIMKIFVVIPTIRNLRFLTSWKNEFADCQLLIVEDNVNRQIQIPACPCQKVYHYGWGDIKNDFGEDEWIFSRRNAGIRSYGFWKAYQLGADVIITLDDDCYPADHNFIRQHVDNLSALAPTGWAATYPHPDFMFTRGFPYTVRDKFPVVISHGLWTNKIDLDGQTEIKNPVINMPSYPPIRQFIPPGVYFPMCSMNLAFTRDAVPLMYFPLMGSDPNGSSWGFDRFDDIWAGIFAKKICDHLDLSVVNGSPFVEHRKASDPLKNITKEKAGIIINESLWRVIDRVKLTKKTIPGCYRELADKTVFPAGSYFRTLQKAMLVWANLFTSPHDQKHDQKTD
jgi:hypothetical protein